MSHKDNQNNHEQFSQHAELKVITYNQSLHLHQSFPSTSSSDSCFLTDFWAIFRSLNHFLFIDNIEKFKENLSKVLNTFENIMETKYLLLLKILWKMEHLPQGANAPFTIIF